MSIETHHMTQAVQTLLKERALMEGKGEKEDMVSQGAETAKMVVNDVRKTQEQAAELEKEKAKDKWQQRYRKECEFWGKIYGGTVDNDTER